MVRTVTVKEVHTGVVVGRAMWDGTRVHLVDINFKDFSGGVMSLTGKKLTPEDGEAFLDGLMRKYDGTYVRAFDEGSA